MCTAISLLTSDHYFGRNLDLEFSYDETVTVTPRNYPFRFRMMPTIKHHYAMIGMATVAENYPLYYEATNEYGLSMAGLNFPGNAFYHSSTGNKDNIAPFEFIPWILGQCQTVSQARTLLERINLAQIPFSDNYPISPLHWMISDAKESIVVEPMRDGIRIFENPIGVLTNNPPFDYHIYNLANYLNLTREEPVNRFTETFDLVPYSRGMGAIGLPGDLSSASRFVKAAFTKLNSVCGDDEMSSVSQFFHILGSVTQQNGCVVINGAFEKTVYACCCNTNKGIYYYKTYENSQITAVKLANAQTDSDTLKVFPLVLGQQIRFEN